MLTRLLLLGRCQEEENYKKLRNYNNVDKIIGGFAAYNFIIGSPDMGSNLAVKVRYELGSGNH